MQVMPDRFIHKSIMRNLLVWYHFQRSFTEMYSLPYTTVTRLHILLYHDKATVMHERDG
jgi:hypothetical protein